MTVPGTRSAPARLHHVLVSGGSRGLGFAIVDSLLQSGNRVTTFSRNASVGTKRLAKQHPERFLFLEGDIAQPNTADEVIKSAEARFGSLTALVNNAGITEEGLLARQPVDVIDRLLDVNLAGPLRLTRRAIRSMMIQGFGRIVNVSSIVSVSGYKGTAVYSATKGGIDAMTRALARELGPRNITVNSVAPGYMDTDLVANMSPKHLAQIVRRTPLGRAGTVDDVTGLVAFLLSDAAAFISGQTIVADGGLTA